MNQFVASLIVSRFFDAMTRGSSVYTVLRCAKSCKIRGHSCWPNMSPAVNKCLFVVNVSEDFWYWLALVRFSF